MIFDPMKIITTMIAAIMMAGLVTGYVQQWKKKSKEKKENSIKLWIVGINLIILGIVWKNAMFAHITWNMIMTTISYGIAIMIVGSAIWSIMMHKKKKKC